MGGYHYLMSSLPALSLDAPPPCTPEEFRFRCQGALSAEDQRELALLLEGRAGEGASRFCRDWAAADAQIRNSAAKVRGSRLGVDPKPFLRSHEGYRVWLDRAVGEALGKPNPLARERGLDEARWAVAEDLGKADPTGLAGVLAWAVQLTLAARWAGRNDAEGKARLERLVQDLEDRAAKSGATDFK